MQILKYYVISAMIKYKFGTVDSALGLGPKRSCYFEVNVFTSTDCNVLSYK